uniref:non-specific serine/threonine protein kinase n=1 Tax=Daucus carota subsp. sativus TaxID=79200 RepID=A0A166IAA8_DAUCS
MGKKLNTCLCLDLCLITLFISSADSSCPIDFTYVHTFPWDTSSCREPVDKSCCQTIQSLLGLGLSKHLKDTSMFYLPNSDAASSCLSDFRAKLGSMNIFPACTNTTSDLVVNPQNCAGIATTKDWVEKVGSSSELDSSCNSDLTGLTKCSSCLDAGLRVSSMLTSYNTNSTKCFYYTILYAAGMVNEYGPEDVRTAACIFGLPLSRSASTNNSGLSRRSILKIVFGSLGAFIGVLAAWGVIILYRKREIERKQDALHEEYVRGVKAKVLPNTGAKWFHVGELEQATGGFSQRNLIGQGGYGIVYKGVLLDGTVVAVKQLLDMDTNGDDVEFTNEAEIISKIRHRNLLALRGFCVTSDAIKVLITDWAWDHVKSGDVEEIFDPIVREDGPKAVMERFVHVGILCAHVMVALRPTISDALKMLEGDIDIPRLPERPLPLGHESFRSSLHSNTSPFAMSSGIRSSIS